MALLPSDVKERTNSSLFRPKPMDLTPRRGIERTTLDADIGISLVCGKYGASGLFVQALFCVEFQSDIRTSA